MLLEGRNAIVYGAAGGIGSAVARGFAREGATVHLTGRTLKKLDALADEIRAAGGKAETAEFDALDETAIDEHAASVASSAGSVDISMNVITHNDVQGTPLVEMSLADLESPVRTAVRTNFLTARAAARHMIRQGSGVILMFGGDGDPLPGYHLGGLQVAFSAMEALRRGLACELGPSGIRVVTLRTGGIPETIPAGAGLGDAIRDMEEATMLRRTASLDDVARVAAFAASDHARSMTATALNISCGAMVD
ncbi:3-oxoacyl-ACP reductase [Amycolatopsis sp. WAC 01375]|uniref:SDR family NAD(P)-dependent oxidoreductase n=1 Tax=unclassified Amycolatopsis TaxID=2618356 RepID=UPI000F7A684E|nr:MULTISPECIES: SDR family oxidoreductase [unclassified Amycolatopsis]RSM71992.1 3-oxoacyl-ACP reductase [Amycolatopsis sp. WAC 01375]RSN32084.1 3-oxoacyl-ACP reductase [Amycolatopsis sp. WAC 01416]